MKLFVVSFLGLFAISTVQTRRILQQVPNVPKSLANSPQNYEYKEVILYLTPSEIRALERNNVLQRNNNEYYSTYLNNRLPAQKQEDVRKTIEHSKTVKPIYETQEEPDENHKMINIPLYYPFQLIPLNEENKENEKKWIEEVKHELEKERENAKIENAWNPISLKQNTQQIKTSLLQHENKKSTTDYLKLMHNAANNFDKKNALKVQDFYRLQYELEQINRNNHAEDLFTHPSQKAQTPLLIIYQSQQMKGTPAREEAPNTLVDIQQPYQRGTKMVYEPRRHVPSRDLYRK